MLFGQKLLSKPVEIANAMNEYFLKKISKLKEGIDLSEADPLEELVQFLDEKNIPQAG